MASHTQNAEMAKSGADANPFSRDLPVHKENINKAMQEKPAIAKYSAFTFWKKREEEKPSTNKNAPVQAGIFVFQWLWASLIRLALLILLFPRVLILSDWIGGGKITERFRQDLVFVQQVKWHEYFMLANKEVT